MLKIIKNIFQNIFFLYRIFFHWNISKIIMLLPVFLFFIISSFFWLWIIKIIIFILLFSFIQLQLSNLNLNYISKKKIKFRNIFTDIKLFIKTSKILLINISILLSIVTIFLLITYITYLLFWWKDFSTDIFMENNKYMFFTTILAIFALIFFILLIYIFYRIFFSYYILSENKDFTALKCIKKSIKITKSKKKFLKFIIINISLLIIFFPFIYFKTILDNKYSDIKNYIYLNNKKILNKPFINNEKIDEFYEYQNLSIKYKEYSNKELIEKSKFLYIMQLLYIIFNFLFIYGILDLIYASFYNKELKK